MRRLMPLDVVLCLRVMFAATVTVWIWAQFKAFVALNTIGYAQVTALGIELVKTPCQLSFWLLERTPMWDLHGESAFNRSKMPTFTTCTGVMAERLPPKSNAVRFRVAIRHWTLVGIALVANVLHWLYHRRKRKDILCGD